MPTNAANKCQVQIDERGRCRWLSAVVLARHPAPRSFAAAGKTAEWLDVQTRDGRTWFHCNPECVREVSR